MPRATLDSDSEVDTDGTFVRVATTTIRHRSRVALGPAANTVWNMFSIIPAVDPVAEIGRVTEQNIGISIHYMYT
jgi:hypothetical protein